MVKWALITSMLAVGCASSHPGIEIRYPAATLNDSALWGGAGFVVSVDPTFFDEVPPGNLIHSIHGITAIASDNWGDGTFGAGPRAEPLHFGDPRFQFAYSGVRRWRDLNDPEDWGKYERATDNLRKQLDDLLAEFHPILVKAIEGGKWNDALRRRLGYANVRALAILHVNLNDPNGGVVEWPRTDGTIHLCITLPWDPEVEPVRPPPRVFIPTSRSTATLFELDPKHVSALLDCYRRILEAVEGPYKMPSEEDD